MPEEMVRSLIDQESEKVSLNTLMAMMETKKVDNELIILDGGATHDVYVCPKRDAIKGTPQRVHLAHGTGDAFVDTEEGIVTFFWAGKQLRDNQTYRGF